MTITELKIQLAASIQEEMALVAPMHAEQRRLMALISEAQAKRGYIPAAMRKSSDLDNHGNSLPDGKYNH